MGATDKAIQTLFKLSKEEKTLWTNASPTSAMSDQSIPIAEIEKYDAIKWKGRFSGATEAFATSGETAEGEPNLLSMTGFDATSSSLFYSMSRSVEKTSTGIRVRTGSYLENKSGALTIGASANICIPIEVIGVRLLGGAIRKIKACLTTPLFVRKEVA